MLLHSAVADALLAVAGDAPLPGPAAPPACVAAALASAAAAAAAPHAIAPFCARHAAQQAGILAHMAAAGLLPPAEGAVYAELGAGRGYLSLLLAEAYGTCVRACASRAACGGWNDARRRRRAGEGALLLVERRAYRMKAERSLRRLPRVTCLRLRCDVADLDLAAAPLPPVPPHTDCADAAVAAAEPGADATEVHQRQRPVVVIAKHLCGAGTDVALRCAARCAGARAAGAGAVRLAGVAVAPCCHHACRWSSFCGKRALRAAGIGPLQFALATRMASWAIDARAAAMHAAASAAEEGNEGSDAVEAGSAAPGASTPAEERWRIGAAERVAVGFAAKRLLDGARVAWAAGRCNGAAALVRYCDARESPENRLILLRCADGGA